MLLMVVCQSDRQSTSTNVATNDLERLLITDDGRVLIGTDDTDSDGLERWNNPIKQRHI